MESLGLSITIYTLKPFQNLITWEKWILRASESLEVTSLKVKSELDNSVKFSTGEML